MTMKLFLMLGFLLGIFLVIKEQTPTISEKSMSYEEALVLSKQNHKPIMLKLTANNCKYCVKMDREVLADTEVNALLLEHFIPVTIEVDKEPIPLGIEIKVTPTFIFVNEHEKILSTLSGAWSKTDFMDLLRNRI